MKHISEIIPTVLPKCKWCRGTATDEDRLRPTPGGLMHDQCFEEWDEDHYSRTDDGPSEEDDRCAAMSDRLEMYLNEY